MVDFRKLLSPSTLIRMRAEREEMHRISKLPDQWLARELLRLGREVLRVRGDTDPRHSYTTGLTFRVIPYLASRLDPSVKLLPHEKYGYEEAQNAASFLPGMSDEDLRKAVTSYLSNASLTYGLTFSERENRAVQILSRVAENGNPIMIALDRITHHLASEPVNYLDEREPLAGYHLVIATDDGNQSVMFYDDELAPLTQRLVDLREVYHNMKENGRDDLLKTSKLVSEMAQKGHLAYELSIRDQDDHVIESMRIVVGEDGVLGIADDEQNQSMDI